MEGKSVEEKDAQPTERTAALWGLSSKIDSRIWVNFTRNGRRLWVKASRATTHRRVKEFGYSCHQKRLTWAKEKKNWDCSPVVQSPLSDESKFCISFGNQGPRVWRKGGEAQSPSCLESSAKFPQSVMIWVQCHLLVLVHWVFWKPTSLHPVNQYIWSTSCFLLLTSFLKMLISFSSRTWHLPTPPKAPKLVKWPWCYCAWLASKLTRPEPHRESMMVLSRGKWETRDQKIQMSWRPLSKKHGHPYHLNSATNWSPPCHAELRQ